MMILKSVVATLLMICLIGSTQAASDLSGTWELNGNKGENVPMGGKFKQTIAITQTTELLTLDFTDVFQGDPSNRQIKFDLNGATVDNLAPMIGPSKTTSKWDGEKLVTRWVTVNATGTEVIRTETIALIDDGAELTVTSERANKPTRVMVYEKQ